MSTASKVILILGIVGILGIAYFNQKISQDLDLITEDNEKDPVSVPRVENIDEEVLRPARKLPEDDVGIRPQRTVDTLEREPVEDQIILIN